MSRIESLTLSHTQCDDWMDGWLVGWWKPCQRWSWDNDHVLTHSRRVMRMLREDNCFLAALLLSVESVSVCGICMIIIVMEGVRREREQKTKDNE